VSALEPPDLVSEAWPTLTRFMTRSWRVWACGSARTPREW